jgi:hypothetical protein
MSIWVKFAKEVDIKNRFVKWKEKEMWKECHPELFQN